MYFYPAEQLKKEFAVTASFYRFQVGDKKFLCRNHAIIKRKEVTKQEEPNAVIVMANPGSCSPNIPLDKIPVIKQHPVNLLYVDVNPDPTQYQLMRLMKVRKWDVVSIINLSDVCAGKMTHFKEILIEFEQHYINEHSIFSDNRIEELEEVLKKSKSRIIPAWGQNLGIRNLANKAIQNLKEEHQIVGLPSRENKWRYRHPNPRLQEKCVKWLEDMEQLLKEEETVKRGVEKSEK
ncbi:hypothetical protein V7112_22930 [Bacillus sp. JJ1566]|uniref:hypothetical protein n=1 Tax=Bacillus sp. JJ1566 TaxID=3122961 RepID=UPI002FFEFA85